jgi:predicted ArsR family transcriptional regulator
MLMELPLLRGTKGRILKLLRRGERTVDELAAPLEITPNAVRAHLTELERDGLVQQRAVRRGPRKPSFGFSLTESAEVLFPKRYDWVLRAVLEELRRSLPTGAIEELLRRAGERLAAPHAHRIAALPVDGRLPEVLRLIGELGGEAELVAGPDPAGQLIVEGGDCPLRAVVPGYPEACLVLKAFLQVLLPDAAVYEVCLRPGDAGSPHCRFIIERRAS